MRGKLCCSKALIFCSSWFQCLLFYQIVVIMSPVLLPAVTSYRKLSYFQLPNFSLSVTSAKDSSKSSHDPEYTDCKTTSTGGKNYTKARTFSVTEESCILADRRLTSIRLQSDQLLAVVGSEKNCCFTINNFSPTRTMSFESISEMRSWLEPSSCSTTLLWWQNH